MQRGWVLALIVAVACISCMFVLLNTQNELSKSSQGHVLLIERGPTLYIGNMQADTPLVVDVVVEQARFLQKAGAGATAAAYILGKHAVTAAPIASEGTLEPVTGDDPQATVATTSASTSSAATAATTSASTSSAATSATTSASTPAAATAVTTSASTSAAATVASTSASTSATAAAAAAAAAAVAAAALNGSSSSMRGPPPFRPINRDSCYPSKQPADCRVCIVMPFCSKTDAMMNAVLSVLQQSHTNWELKMVLNNLETGAACPWTAAQTLERVQAVSSPAQMANIELLETRGTNMSVFQYAGLGRNIGMRACTSELVAFLDDDDLMTPDRLEVSTAMLHKRHAVFVCSDAYLMILQTQFHGRFQDYNFTNFNTSLENLAKVHLPSFEYFVALRWSDSTWFTPDPQDSDVVKVDSRLFRHKNFATTSTVLANLTYIRQYGLEFNMNMRKAQDWDFWHRIFKAENYALPVYHSSKRLAVYDGFEHGRQIPSRLTVNRLKAKAEQDLKRAQAKKAAKSA